MNTDPRIIGGDPARGVPVLIGPPTDAWQPERRTDLDPTGLARFLRASITTTPGMTPIEAREILTILRNAVDVFGVTITPAIGAALHEAMARFADSLEGGAS